MPEEGVVHNLVIVNIDKKYPGQGMKVLSALFGAGQMMFSKYIVVMNSGVRSDDYDAIASEIFRHARFDTDTLRFTGPLDVLDHSSDTFSFGGKMGIDATVKMTEELNGRKGMDSKENKLSEEELRLAFPGRKIFKTGDHFITILPIKNNDEIFNLSDFITTLPQCSLNEGSVVVIMDKNTELLEADRLLWLTLSNTDPCRDIHKLKNGGILIQASSKTNVFPPFPREWPNIVCSDTKTINIIDNHWDSLELGPFIVSPSLEMDGIYYQGGASISQKSVKTK